MHHVYTEKFKTSVIKLVSDMATGICVLALYVCFNSSMQCMESKFSISWWLVLDFALSYHICTSSPLILCNHDIII